MTKSRLSLSSNQQKIILSLATASLLFTGCGGGGGGTTPTDTTQSAYLIDSAVEGIDYTCGSITGTTNSEGKFTYDATKCPSGVEFKLGSLSLGTINPSTINTDTYLTIQELAGTTRDNVTDGNVTKLAVLLQSLDDDNNPNNGIVITQTIKNAIVLDGNLSDKTDTQISNEITARGKTEKDVNDALTHLLSTLSSKGITTTANINPTDFNLTSVTGKALNTTAESDTITVQGLTIPTYITISNGEYSLDNGTTWKSTKSLVSNGQTVKVRHTTANSLSGTTTTTVKIGGVTKTFGSTTRTTPPPPSKSLLRTGQANCYNASNAVVTCSDDVSVLRDDGYYAWKGNGIARTFTRDNTNNIVTDTKTELQWQDGTTPATMNWATANTYCTDLTFGTYDDWRLPSIEELATIANKGVVNPSKFTEFQNIVSGNYWTSTTDASDTSVAWGIDFYYGGNGWYYKTDSGYVRCVRAGQ